MSSQHSDQQHGVTTEEFVRDATVAFQMAREHGQVLITSSDGRPHAILSIPKGPIDFDLESDSRAVVNDADAQYLALVRDILEHGVPKGDRTGTGTLSLFGRQVRFDLAKGFPLLTTKKVWWKGVVRELLWFLRGDTNVAYLHEHGVHIWDQWVQPDGTIGSAYGKQWRSWPARPADGWLPSPAEFKKCLELNGWECVHRDVGRTEIWALPEPPSSQAGYAEVMVPMREDAADFGRLMREALRSFARYECRPYESVVAELTPGIDQIARAVEMVRTDPDSRRNVVSAWNVADLDSMALQPCHALWQLHVANGRLSCQLYQRSGDVFLGVPFNIASYALLTIMIAKVTGLEPGEFIHTFGDVHLYSNHIDQARLQLTREPRPLPRVELKDKTDLFAFGFDDIRLVGYDPHPAIKAQVAV